MCILDILRLHISHNYKRKYSKSKSECTDMSMINWSRKKVASADERSRKMLLQMSDFDDNLPSVPGSICCSEYIINGGFCSKQHLYKEEDKWVFFGRDERWFRTDDAGAVGEAISVCLFNVSCCYLSSVLLHSYRVKMKLSLVKRKIDLRRQQSVLGCYLPPKVELLWKTK